MGQDFLPILEKNANCLGTTVILVDLFFTTEYVQGKRGVGGLAQNMYTIFNIQFDFDRNSYLEKSAVEAEKTVMLHAGKDAKIKEEVV